MRFVRVSIACLSCICSSAAFATDGMNLEGYGAVATAQGGAAMAYDNGTAALMNNPATLALGADGWRVDLAGGVLGPHVRASDQSSSANAFYMPALGMRYKNRDWVFGFGVFSQGGMGADYSNSSFYDTLRSTSGASVADPGLQNRSELGVARALIPVAWKATDQLTIGGSIDYVRASLDLKMLIDGARFGDMMMGSQRFGKVTPDAQLGGMLNSLGGAPINWGYFDFSDNSRFNGAASGAGWAGKIGTTYQVNSELTLGAVYHSKTHLSDLTANNATMSLNVAGMTMPLQGKVKIVDFQWPDMYGVGFSYRPNDHWQWVADYRRIGWQSVMKDFHMVFESNNAGTLDMRLNQNWKDQNVLMLGTAYRATSALTLRAGLNLANNPVPNEMVNPLFPAIVRNHLTTGFGYAFDPRSSLDFSLTYAPKIKVHSEFSNTDITHQQVNAQILYSLAF